MNDHDPIYDCQFKITPTLICGEHTGGTEVIYCRQHRRTKCRCGCQATHLCDFNDYRKCEEAICDNPYCIANHNIEKHINKKPWE